MVRFSLFLCRDMDGLTGGSHCFPRLKKQHDGAYLAEQLAKCLKDYGIEEKVRYVRLLVN